MTNTAYKFQTILHPTDLRPESACAFNAAVDLARLSNGTVHVLHVLAPPAVVNMDGTIIDPTDASIGENWEAFKEQAKETGVQVNCIALVSDQANAIARILSKVQESDCDLIVMATQGRTGLTRLIWNSVAEETVRQSSRPVLVVKPNQQ